MILVSWDSGNVSWTVNQFASLPSTSFLPCSFVGVGLSHRVKLMSGRDTGHENQWQSVSLFFSWSLGLPCWSWTSFPGLPVLCILAFMFSNNISFLDLLQRENCPKFSLICFWNKHLILCYFKTIYRQQNVKKEKLIRTSNKSLLQKSQKLLDGIPPLFLEVGVMLGSGLFSSRAFQFPVMLQQDLFIISSWSDGFLCVCPWLFLFLSSFMPILSFVFVSILSYFSF